MIPPQGFKATLYPLRHKFKYGTGLSAVTATDNTTILTLVKNYTDTTNVPSSIKVNPMHGSFEVETGAICGPMSIIDRLKLTLKFNLTKLSISTDKFITVSASWMPIFFSFPEKLDAADDKTTTTVAAILELTKDATKEDITPAFAAKLPVGGSSVTVHPTSSANFNEVFGTLNLTTNTAMEGVPFDNEVFHNALRYYSNKGALKACIGKTRRFTLSTAGGSSAAFKTFHLDKFVPRPIRRIVPYTYFGILIHVPLILDAAATHQDAAGTADVAHIGIKATVSYDEWNLDHDQDMSGG